MSGNNKDENEIKVIFHVHLPENIDKYGQPVVLGDGKELGSWEKPNIKLRQPFPQNPTYWQSDPVTISLSNLEEGHDIEYKFAIYVPKTMFRREEKIAFEGNGTRDNRMLDIRSNNQFGIWKNNNYDLRINNVRDFAFVDYIYNSIKDNNLKSIVMEYQYLLTIYTEPTIRVSNLRFIINRIDDRLREKRLFLCLLLGYYIPRQQGYGHYELAASFPSGLLLDALEDYKKEALPSDCKDQMYTAIIYLVQHNAFQMKFNWLNIFKITAEVDPNYTFIDHLRALRYSSDSLLAKFIAKGAEVIRPYIDGIDFETYVKLAKVKILNIIVFEKYYY